MERITQLFFTAYLIVFSTFSEHVNDLIYLLLLDTVGIAAKDRVLRAMLVTDQRVGGKVCE